MYLMGSLLLALGLSIFIVGKIAKMLHANKPSMWRILLASLFGSIAAFITLIAMSSFGKSVAPATLMFLSILSMFIVSMSAFKFINVMSWPGAITTNVAHIAFVLMTSTVALVLNGEPIDKAIKSVRSISTVNTAIVEGIVSGNTPTFSAGDKSLTKSFVKQLTEPFTEPFTELSDEQALIDEDTDTAFKELDLLPVAVIKELNVKNKLIYKKPKFYLTKLSNARSAVGKSIRIKSLKGKSITGTLRSIRNNELIIEQRISGGLASFSVAAIKVETLEVYR